MRNPWRMQDGPDNKINRNNFPMSFQYNGTFKYGKIYPIGLWRTIPGASYQIDSTLALNFMPTSFPIQTRQRAYVHFFYGRDRNFWKDYKDFVNGMNPELVKPYIDEGVTLARTGKLLDYLGVPTTIVGDYGNSTTIDYDFDTQGIVSIEGLTYDFGSTTSSVAVEDACSWFEENVGNSVNFLRGTSHTAPSRVIPLEMNSIIQKPSNVRINLSFNNQNGLYVPLNNVPTETQNGYNYVSPLPRLDNLAGNYIRVIKLVGGVLTTIYLPELLSDGSVDFEFEYDPNNTYYLVYPSASYQYYSNAFSQLPFYQWKPIIKAFYLASGVNDIDFNTSPYWRSNDTRGKNTIKLSAIPPRMYETIYNLYFRNPQNNPYILNGKPEYNVFIPTKDGGADSNLYELRSRNWEDDFLTTAVQTPQQGIAPLVGLTDRGATVTLTNEDGSVTRYKTNLDENGNVIGIETTDSSEPLLTQALIDAVSYGISIEDLRNVNAMQKWLELNLRKGYQYKDIIEARWGISISYNELDLPEFIGGFTQEVGLQAVTQTTSHGEGIEGALGWQAGRMYAAGSGRSITHYCEEEGYIMALLTVVPVPNYSQLLPKHWFTRDLLESYQPEFNHIGFQPITYKEVCPIQAFQESTQNVDVLEQTFGYQRPWYEYFNQVDEVHGQFRTTFKDFLINRTFDVKPELSESFLLVDPNQVNDVFAVTTDDDKIIGAIEHRIIAKLPISLYAQARLE